MFTDLQFISITSYASWDKRPGINHLEALIHAWLAGPAMPSQTLSKLAPCNSRLSIYKKAFPSTSPFASLAQKLKAPRQLTFAPSLMDIADAFFAVWLPMANPNLHILAGAGFVLKSSASSLAARFSALRLELSPPLLEETVLVFTGFSASSSGPGEVETTYQDELFLLSRLMGAATSKSIILWVQ